MHLIATFFFAIAAKQLSVLSDIDFIYTLDKLGSEKELLKMASENNYAKRIVYLSYWKMGSLLIGLVIAFTISLIITLRNRHFWLNSLLVLLIGLALNKFGFFDNKYIDKIFYSIGRLAVDFGLIYKFIINGILLTIVGVFVFFSKWTNNFIFSSTQNRSGTILSKNDVA